MFNNLIELIKSMPTEEMCRDYVAKQRWDGKPVCPYCKHEKCYVIEGGARYKCASKTCFKRFTVTVGTIFEASNIPLSKWLTAIYLISAHKKGISSYQLSRDIGVTQKTSWFMLHRIREMLRTAPARKLDNVVEADEMYVGGSIANKHNSVRKKFAQEGNNWQANKTTVLGVIEREGEAMAVVVNNNTTRQIVKVLNDNLMPTANLITDTHNYYTSMSGYFNHSTINHAANEYGRGAVYTNTVEGMFSHFKRMVYGIYHQISRKHCQRYLDEFICRYNTRKVKDAERFQMTFKGVERRLDYKTLVNPQNDNLEPVTQSKGSYIIQLKGDEVIGQYTSPKEAQQKTGIKSANIYKVLKGTRNIAGGFRWIYA